MPDETLRDFHDAELFRIQQPKRVGGVGARVRRGGDLRRAARARLRLERVEPRSTSPRTT